MNRIDGWAALVLCVFMVVVGGCMYTGHPDAAGIAAMGGLVAQALTNRVVKPNEP